MALIRVEDHRFVAAGEIGYESASQFAKLCEQFMREHRAGPAVLDLGRVEDLVSPCLTAIYEDARIHRPAELVVIAPARLEPLFAPGQAEGLFTIEPPKATDR